MSDDETIKTTDPQDGGPKDWLKQKDEPARWHERFRRFCRMGPSRSLLGLVNRIRQESGKEKKQTIPGSWSEMCKLWRWRERAEAWDAHMRRREDAKWEKRQLELRENEWNLGGKLMEKGLQMLDYPLAAVTQEQQTGTSEDATRVVNTVNPSRWTMRDAAFMVKTGSDVSRLAAGLATEHRREEVTGKDGGPIEVLDIEAIRKKRWQQVAPTLAEIEADKRPDA